MEKVFNTMRLVGIGNIAMGIVILVTGIAVGTVCVVTGSNLLKRKNDIVF